MKLYIEQSDSNGEVEITIKCGAVIDARLRKLIAQIQSYSFSVAGKKEQSVYSVPFQDVYYIESVEEKTFLYVQNDVYECDQRLYELEEQLADTSFVRVAKSLILNIDKLKSVRPLFNGKWEATMQNEEKILINRHYVPAFKQKFGI